MGAWAAAGVGRWLGVAGALAGLLLKRQRRNALVSPEHEWPHSSMELLRE